MAGTLRVGTSGWQYDDWRSRFYPQDLARTRWFDFYARHFDTVEVNSTFYRLPEAATFDAWRAAAPRGFRYAVKYSRYGSHLKRLKDPERHLDAFVERAARLGSALGPVLVQLPPNFKADPVRLDAFLAAAPRRWRWAVEFRDASWLDDAVYAVLAKRGAALCIHDLLDDHPRRVTAGFVYLRFHGKNDGGSYGPRRLAAEATRVRNWLAGGLDVYAYFNNDRDGNAVRDAQALRRYAAG